MLDQAIIDATALREAAIKSAEQAVVEKYSTEIREAVEKLMEENDFEEDKTVDEQIVEADEKGKGYSFVENTELSDLEENDLVEIDVKALFEEVQKERMSEELEISDDLFEEEYDLSEMMADGEADYTAAPSPPADMTEELDEDLELSEDLEESLKFDFEPVPEGQTRAYGATNSQKKEQAMLMDVMLAVEEENSKLEKKNESLVKTNKNLKETNRRLKETVQNIANKFDEIKLMNSKLFYTNKTLMDDSLNERQKGNLVESINKAQSSEQAKIVYETLKSTVGNAPSKKQPESLSEAVGKRSSTSLLLKARKSDEKPKVSESSIFANRMQILAGIKHHKED
jgi:hypothetical protein